MKIIFKFVFSAVTLCWALNTQAALVTFYGEDRSFDTVALAASHLNSTTAQTNFLAMLVNPVNESFEGFSVGQAAPIDIFVGGTATTRATLTGSAQVDNKLEYQRFPENGEKYLKTTFPTGGSIPVTITFDSPIAAFGFFAIDVGDLNASNDLTFSMSDGSSESLAISTLRGGLGNPAKNEGSILYLGAYDDGGRLFNSVKLESNNPLHDRITYDSMTAAPQVVPLPPAVLLFFSGLTGMALLGRRKAKQA